MTDNEVLDRFISTREQQGYLLFIVEMIEWPLVHLPVSNYIVASLQSAQLSEEEIREEKVRISKMRRYFKRCRECGELNPVGWMDDAKVCQGCASANHRVVY